MTLTADRPVTADEPLLLPEHPPRVGAITRLLLLRLVVVLAIVQVVAAVLIFAVGTDAARAAGTSLVFPGAGFLYDAWPVLFVLTAALLVVGLVLWWGASAHLAIPLVWLASVGGAAALADGPRLVVGRGTTWPWAIVAAYALAAGFVGVAAYRFERAYRTKLAKVAELNEYLATAPVPERRPVVRDPDSMDGELLRWCYSIANQPDDGLLGLDWGEQFHSGTQLRYQLNALCWALSLYATNFVPNAQTQADAALVKLIEKHTDLRVWKYWRTLNLLGNFDPNPDPIRRDNIMLSAFFCDVLNMYEAATGSDRFDRPGSLTFVWKDGRTFEYDHHSIAAAVEENYQRSRLGFFPCEPGWSFAFCNVFGAQSLYGHDTLHGTQQWDRVKAKWVNALDNEYLTPDGSYAHIRSNLVGLSWDTGEVPGGHYFATGSNRFADILPDHARRAAALERRGGEMKIRGLATMVTDGRLELELPATLERSRARRSALAMWNAVIGGARMFGEHGLADAALDASARQCGTGRRWPERPLDSGFQGVSGHMIVRWSNPLSTADLNIRGYEPPAGPILTATAWDRVLVTEARSPDGERLELRLEPLSDDALHDVELRFDHLEPDRTYELTGTAQAGRFVAGGDGGGALRIDVASSLRLTLTPAGGVS